MWLDSSIREQIGYYEVRWEKEHSPNYFSLARMAAVLEILVKIEFPFPTHMCDLGCGSGWASGMLSVLGPVLGVDLDVQSTAVARFQNCRFESLNILEWDPPEAQFDLVFSFEVIEHIERPLQPLYLSKARKLLRPGGHLLLTTPNRPAMDAIRGGGRTWSNQPIEEWLNAKELMSLLPSAGFQVIDLSSVVLDVARRGLFSVANSARVASLLRPVCLYHLWCATFRQLLYGLHLVVLARKV